MVGIVLFGMLGCKPSAPIAHWQINESRYQNGQIVACTGPNLMVSGFPNPIRQGGMQGYALKDEGESFVYPWDDRARWPAMPKKDFTVAVRFSIPNQARLDGLVGCIFQPDEGLAGWRVTIEKGRPRFTLAKPGFRPVTVTGPLLTPHAIHHLVARYDGKAITLGIDGKALPPAKAEFGDLVYNSRAGICLGDWWEGPRSYRFEGGLFEAALFDVALSDREVDLSLAEAAKNPVPLAAGGDLQFTVEPFFQYPTNRQATVVWETSSESSTLVRYGLSAKNAKVVHGIPSTIHRQRLTGLLPGTTYFVQVESKIDGKQVTSKWSSFRTASDPGTEVKVAIVGDTQDHPEVNHQVAKAVFAERPDAFMVVGDLVGMGWKKDQWVQDFFGSMRPLLSYVPLLPVLGNHDRNARLYYDYMGVPAPEFCYTYRTGDVEFFVVDTNRDVKPGSKQYRWLETSLKASKARWKIAAHHHPPYSSDTDDFGNSEVEPTTEGDPDVRSLCTLYDRYSVDLCFTGHIHSYERTAAIVGGKATPNGKGTVYVVVGGGGGDLETAKPTRATFSRVVRSAHHFATIQVNRAQLELRAYDTEGKLFDFLTLRKPVTEITKPFTRK